MRVLTVGCCTALCPVSSLAPWSASASTNHSDVVSDLSLRISIYFLTCSHLMSITRLAPININVVLNQCSSSLFSFVSCALRRANYATSFGGALKLV